MFFDGEFRKKDRQGVDLVAGVEGANIIDFSHRTKIKNINLEGMHIETTFKLNVGEKRNIRFYIDGGESLKMNCRVIWHQPYGGLNRYGIIFSGVSLWNKFKLTRYIAKKRKLETVKS